jgi:hypothetical protein
MRKQTAGIVRTIRRKARQLALRAAFVFATAGCSQSTESASGALDGGEPNLGRSICSPGSFLAEPSGACTPCPYGAFTAAPDLSSCSVWTSCGPGSFVAIPGTSTSDQSCAACPSGSTTNGVNLRACTRDGSCPPGSVPEASGKCAACEPGTYCAGGDAPRQICGGDTWDSDADATTPCAQTTSCAPGQFVSVSPNATTNRGCTPCDSGLFSATTNAGLCTPWKRCEAGSYVSASGSATRDRACATCPSGTSSIEANQVVCVPVNPTECPPGWTLVDESGKVACAPCEAGTYCPGGATLKEACPSGMWDDDQRADSVCVQHASCAPGEYVSAEGTATSNRDCTACPRGWLSNASNATSCTRNALFQLGGPGNEEMVAKAFRNDGSGAIVASFTTTLTLDCGTTVTYSPDAPFVLVNLDENLKCTWAKTLPASLNWYAPQVTLLGNGDLLVVGTTTKSTDLGDGMMRNTALNSVTYMTRLDGQSGVPIWYRDYAHGDPANVWALVAGTVLEPDGQAFVFWGDYQTTIDLGGGVLTPVSSLEPVLARYSVADGSHLWSTMYTGSGPQDFLNLGFASDGLIVSGAGRGGLALGGACGSVAWAGGGRGSLLSKFVRSGDGYVCTWYRVTDALCDETWGYSFAIDDYGGIYQTGSFCGTKSFAGIPMTATTGRSWYENRSTFLAAYTADGNPVWSSGGITWNTSTGMQMFPRFVNGYLLAAHTVTTTPDYGGGLTQELRGINDAFLLKIDPQSGVVLAMHPLAGEGDQAVGVRAVTPEGQIILEGWASGDFAVDSKVAVTGVQGRDAFVARIDNPFASP